MSCVRKIMPDVKLRHIYRCFIESVLQCVTGHNTVKSSSAVMTCSTYAIGGECREMILQLYANQQLMSQLHFSICHQMHACVSAAACSSVQQQQLQNLKCSNKAKQCKHLWKAEKTTEKASAQQSRPPRVANRYYEDWISVTLLINLMWDAPVSVSQTLCPLAKRWQWLKLTEWK